MAVESDAEGSGIGQGSRSEGDDSEDGVVENMDDSDEPESSSMEAMGTQVKSPITRLPDALDNANVLIVAAPPDTRSPIAQRSSKRAERKGLVTSSRSWKRRAIFLSSPRLFALKNASSRWWSRSRLNSLEDNGTRPSAIA